MSVYGAVPFVHAHGDDGSYGVLWLNPSETFVDVGCSGGGGGGAPATADGAAGAGGVCTHWFSAAGVVDAFLFSGAAPADVTQHAALTGTTPLPPLFALGYHQCRWNYRDEDDVARVCRVRAARAPARRDLARHRAHRRQALLHVGPEQVRHAARVQAALGTGRKMVMIVDPHLKADDAHLVFADAQRQGCSCAPPTTRRTLRRLLAGPLGVGRPCPAARDYWRAFAPGAYEGSSESLYTWNDMNEPFVFDGPEITMPPDLTHRDGAGREYDIASSSAPTAPTRPPPARASPRPARTAPIPPRHQRLLPAPPALPARPRPPPPSTHARARPPLVRAATSTAC